MSTQSDELYRSKKSKLIFCGLLLGALGFALNHDHLIDNGAKSQASSTSESVAEAQSPFVAGLNSAPHSTIENAIPTELSSSHDRETETESENQGQSAREMPSPALAATDHADTSKPDLRQPSPLVLPVFWLWGGLGANYQFYQQTIPSIQGSGTFQNIQAPVVSIRGGFQGDTWGLSTGFRQTPGQMESKGRTRVINGGYHWTTLEIEGLRRVSPSWNLRFGVQHHLMPFMVFQPATQILDVRTNTLTMATLGFDKSFPIANKVRGEWTLRYQQPISSGASDGERFDVKSKAAFDGSLGGIYNLNENTRLGLFWYGQYHQYRFNYGSGMEEFSGTQKILYSNIEVRLGLEF
ncbi:MAG: hypothetical protein EOP05_06010 [Proteobacteria bacterium]|nr:MAG: hypothetical protein EOP05_06010 [Pseudomonadota bacterium]